MQGKTILLIEDNFMVAHIAVFVLKRQGFTVLHCEDYLSGIDTLATINQLDLLFTDILLPEGKVGTDIARLAREKIPGLPVLFSSGYTKDKICQQALQEMLQQKKVAFLPKPYQPSQLIEAIKKLLGNEAN